MKKRIIPTLFLFLLINNAHSFNSEAIGSSEDLNLLLITLDTTRADVIGLYNNESNNTPNIDQLGEDGISFKHCYANVPLTLPSHCSLFTGRLPYVHQVRNNGTYFLHDDELTLAEIFRDRGYKTAAVISSFTLCSKFGVGQGFETYNEDFDSIKAIQNFHTEITADHVYNKFQNLIDSLENRKFFYWIHFYDPHFPYISHENNSLGDSQSQWKRYESEVKYVDSFIGKMISTLETKQLMENTVIVIVGDHGEAFGEHEEYGHGIFCYEESLKVPFIMYSEHLFKKKRSIEERISIIDILPSLLELYSFDIPENIQGKSFLSLLQGKKEKQKRTIYFESMFGKEENNWSPPIGIINNDLKFISLPTPELYHLKNDTNETENLFLHDRKTSTRLTKMLEQIISDSSTDIQQSRRKLSRNDIEKLESLGYISHVSNKSKSIIDPKVGISAYTEVEEIKAIISNKQFGLAEDKLSNLISRHPEVQFPGIFQIKYQIEKSKRNDDSAIKCLREALSIFPNHESIKLNLASELFTTGNYAETLELCEELLGENDNFTSAYLLLAEVNKKLNKIEASLGFFEKAISIEPQNAMIQVGYADLLMRNDDLEKSLTTVLDLGNKGNFTTTSVYLDLISELSNRLLSVGEFSKAIPIMKIITENDTENPAAWANLGSAYSGLEQLDSALECYKKALEIDGDFAQARSNIGVVFLQKFYQDKRTATLEKAKESFNEALRLTPNLGEAYHGRALVQVSFGNIEDAIRDFARAIELEPELIDAYFNIINVLMQEENYTEAYKYSTLCKKRFYHVLPPDIKAEVDRMINELKDRIKYN